MFPFVIAYIKWMHKDSLSGLYPVDMDALYAQYKIKNTRLLTRVGIVASFVILVLFMHPIHHQQSGWIALIGAMGILIVGARNDVGKVLNHVEWDTLLFFGGLFVIVAALAEMGLIRFIGEAIVSLIESASEDDRMTVALLVILWVSAVVSGFLSNIAFAATMAPVIQIVGEDETLGLDMQPLAWALSFGTCLGGNLTLIGSAANLIAASVASHNGMHISFLEFFKTGGPVWLITVIIATLYMLTLYVWIGV